MMKKITVFLIIFFLSFPFIFGLEFIYPFSQEKMEKGLVKVNGEEYYFSNYSLEKEIPSGFLFVDKLETPYLDFLGKKVKETEYVFLYPLGSVNGIVKNNLTEKIKIKIFCPSTGYSKEVVSNEGGYFYLYLPAEKCLFESSFKSYFGYQEKDIVAYQNNLVEINLEKKKENNYLMAVLILILLAVLVISFVLFRKRKKILFKKPEKKGKKEGVKKEAKEVKEKGAKEWSETTKKILATLNPKEKQVVEFLLKNNYSASQAKIRYEIGIPRTSLSRIIQSLVSKKIIETEKIGKMIKVKLTDFFLGG